MEPDKQIEIQLGHMCNNRCVFCVSGQRTELREAKPIRAEPVLERLSEARAGGISKVTLLGGEPTIQPEFFRIVSNAVALGFSEIVIFTNGVKTARGSFIDDVIATGGAFTWRLSFQGGTGQAHDRTTKKLGSFERLVATMKNLRDRSQRITVNMCVVRSNYESVASFPDLLLPYGVSQLHLDMIRPLDAGARTEDEVRAMMPQYSNMVPYLERMVSGFPAGFDVNIGNLPYCIAPQLAGVIHHDGADTLTVAIDHDDALSDPWDKYENKRRDKIKPESCRACVFDQQCSGVFDTYRRFYGVDELQPVTRERLTTLDPKRRLFTLHAGPLIEVLKELAPTELRIDSQAQQVVASFTVSGEVLRLALRRPGDGFLSNDQFSLHILDSPGDAAAHALIRRVFSALAPGVDLRIARCVARLGEGAPYGELTIGAIHFDANTASVGFTHGGDIGVTIELAPSGARLRSAYRLDRPIAAPSTALIDDVRAAMGTLRG